MIGLIYGRVSPVHGAAASQVQLPKVAMLFAVMGGQRGATIPGRSDVVCDGDLRSHV